LRAVAGAVIEVGVGGERRGGGSQAFAERGELAAAVVGVSLFHQFVSFLSWFTKVINSS
jgi:hypothetical protein